MNRGACFAVLLLVTILCSPALGQEKSGSPARLDRDGDPLPEGAIARLGTLRFRTDIARSPSLDMGVWLTFSPDDKSLIIGDRREGIRLWDLGGEKELRRATSRGQGAVVALSDNGKIMATSRPGTLALWDIAKQARIGELKGTFGRPELLLFSDDATVLARIPTRPPVNMRPFSSRRATVEQNRSLEHRNRDATSDSLGANGRDHGGRFRP